MATRQPEQGQERRAQSEGVMKRRGILAAAALAVGMLTTKGTQSVAGASDTYFTAVGGTGVAFNNAATGYTGGGLFFGDQIGVIALSGETLNSDTNSAYGVYAGGKTYGVYGISTHGGYGVYGKSTANSGVYGESAGFHAVIGSLSANTAGYAGVWGGGNGPNTYGVIGNGLSGTAGVLGKSSGNGSGVLGTNSTGVGVYGISGGGAAPYGVVGATTAPGIALYGVAGVAGAVGFAAGAGVAGAIAGQFSGNVNFFGSSGGNTVTLNGVNLVVANGGTKNAAVPLPDGSYGLLHCVEAPEPWFEDFGEGTLSAGKAEVKLEPTFAATVDTSTLHVFCMPHDETHHLAVKARSGSGFTVVAAAVGDAIAKGVKAGDLNGTFTWRVVAKRKDVKGDRFARFTLPREAKFAPPPIPPEPNLPAMPKAAALPAAAVPPVTPPKP